MCIPRHLPTGFHLEEPIIVRITALTVALLLACIAPILAQTAPEATEETEEEPYDERGFLRDDILLSLSFTQGSTNTYDYKDFRMYFVGQGHYAYEGDDYLDLYLLINRFDRSYDDPRYSSDPITNIFDLDLTHVFGGVDKYTQSNSPVLGATFFSTNMFDDVDFGLGYGRVYNYNGGNVRAMAGVGRNLGYSDDWSPIGDISWTHNLPLGRQWRFRSKVDLMWNPGRTEPEDPARANPDAIYLLDGTLSYQLLKDWALSLRYFNDNGSDRGRSYVSLGVTHRFRRPAPRR